MSRKRRWTPSFVARYDRPRMSKPRVFISYDYAHHKHGKNLLLAWDANDEFAFEFYDESVDVSVHSDAAAVIRQVIFRKINATDIFLCIVAKETHKSGWVTWEIKTADELKKPIVAVKTDSTNIPPDAILGVGASWAESWTFESIKNALTDAT